MNLQYSVFIFAIFFEIVNGAVVVDDGEIDHQGLYSKSDDVDILTNRNFEKKIYGQRHAIVAQFYNSYCGHCRSFAPKFKALAGEIHKWNNIIKLAVIDCSDEENNEICRQFEVMAYPSIRYLHEYYIKGNGNVGDKIQITDTQSKLKAQIITKMQNEQILGRLKFAPSLAIESYRDYADATKDVNGKNFTFLVLENGNSTVGSEIALDLNDYLYIQVKRVHDTSGISNLANIRQFPGLIAVSSSLEATTLVPKENTKVGLLKAINSFLKSKNYVLNDRDLNNNDANTANEHSNENKVTLNTDAVFYSDLEKTIKTSLHTEITRFKTLDGEPLEALLKYLDVILLSFPSRGNLKEYISELRSTLGNKNSWSGGDIYNLVKQLETAHAPVYTTNLEYVRCRGSQPQFRGYSCGLWTLFHTLTVNAAQKPGTESPNVLRAMHGYVKNFFGCTECVTHFLDMAARNRIFDVNENDKAVLWLWIAHNEVNLRLAGDVTEDPEHPKIQFPSVVKCPECRLSRGAWNLPAVYQYLENIYGSASIQALRRARSSSPPASPFSNLDIGMLSLLYMTA